MIAETPGKIGRLDQLCRDMSAFLPLHVVDVGANPIEGEAPYKLLLESGHAKISGFEPNETAFAKLVQQASAQEKYHCAALGAGGVETFHLTRNSGFSSVFRPDPKSIDYLGFQRGAQVEQTFEVQTTRMDDLPELGDIDFLKIDVQGSEKTIVQNGKTKLAQAVLIQAEARFFPIYEGEPSFGDLEAELKSQGFYIHSFAHMKSVATGLSNRTRFRRHAFRQLVDGDVFFVRDLRTIAQFSDAQIAKLAVLGDGVMQAFDLALYCVEELGRRGLLQPSAVKQYLALLPAKVLR